jgi:PBSX family phage terminase large subunit
MATIDLNRCFPEPSTPGVKRGPLPKQAEFLRKALDCSPGAPKYIRYLGGVGSGKTMIGCITVLVWSVLYPGDYLIGRQFFPELRDTTLKTFLEICPPELIVEHRVADAIVRIRGQNGKISNILFRALEEPDKLRSLNLNGFYLDESNQMTENAFWLLTTRLRGKYVRKGIMTTNSDGRSWGWRLFVQKSFTEDETAKMMFYSIKAPSTENTHLPADYVASMLATYTEERRRREVEADEDLFEGAIYPDFRMDRSVVDPFEIPDTWTRVIGMDHGLKNPAAAVFGAVSNDGDIYIYDEFYKSGWLIEEIVKGNKKTGEPGLLHKIGTQKISAIFIDPSTKATRGQTGISEFSTYMEHLPAHVPLLTANNDVSAGIDRVARHFKDHPVTKKPQLYIFKTCKNLINELLEYRWEPLSSGMVGRRNDKEEPRKYNDHACDALRYLIMSRPDPNKVKELPEFKQGWLTPSKLIQAELDALRNPPARDPFQDM